MSQTPLLQKNNQKHFSYIEYAKCIFRCALKNVNLHDCLAHGTTTLHVALGTLYIPQPSQETSRSDSIRLLCEARL